MTYLFENTDPERFQRLCQSLLIDEFPGLQCFPVGQPDGGRDASQAAGSVVLQVKFRRSDEPESAEWMIEALEKELPKIVALAAAGVERYVMVTNARGTAHPDVGRIDRVQAWMKQHIPCTAICLWRDDLDRRLDRAPTALRFKYPEVLTGQDGIELALAQVMGNNKAKQLRAVQAFATAQFQKDQAVKFKQVNLSNELSDLFVDIPLRVNERLLKQLQRKARKDGDEASVADKHMRSLDPIPEDLATLEEGDIYFHHSAGALRTRMGAAEFLLGRNGQESLKRIVLEGAPGQGKSTLAQFVCQVHRARFLAEPAFLDRLSSRYAATAFRLPIKIDLRDLAAFVSSHPDPSAASVEDFVSGLVSKEAGNVAFSTDDFVDVCTSTPVLIFLDGLDEVADLDQRRDLVDAVERCLARLESWNADVQVVVTSRPSIFGKKANFDASGFVTIELANIDPRLVTEYSQKWVKARGLDAQESGEVLSILRDKMQLSHIRELTRNPMQLTILLSLIHQIGYSLPDQRTDLYRRYLELFLIREAEKTPSVKKHSAILVSFIQYLAWVLQSQAESAGSTGSISESDLQAMAREYLIQAKESVDLAEGLFGGGLERIFVLVQRVSGLYEFEVQPLREFFCARHLYETSPVGTYRNQEPRGDRAQRFEALAKNPFWLNVTRFYAGSYEPGEIGSLVMSLKELIASSDPAVSIHARRVAFALLSDWVFANKKSWQEDLIRLACDAVGLDLLASQVYESDTLALDEACGQAVLREIAFRSVVDGHQTGSAYGYHALLDVNGGFLLQSEFRAEVEATSGRRRTDLLTAMLRSGAADDVPVVELLKIAAADDPDFGQRASRLTGIVERRAGDTQNSEPAMQAVVSHALNGDFHRASQVLSLVSALIDLMCRQPTAILAVYRRSDDFFAAPELVERIEGYAAPASLAPRFVSSAVEQAGSHVYRSYNMDFEGHQKVAQLISGIWGPGTRAADELALRAAGLPTTVSVAKAGDMFDLEVDVCLRARHARLKRSSVEWWKTQFATAGSDPQRQMFWVTLSLCWTAPAVFEALRNSCQSLIDGMDDHEFARLVANLASINRQTTGRSDRAGWTPAIADLSDRVAFAVVLGARLTPGRVARIAKGREKSVLTAWADERLRAARLLNNAPKPGAQDNEILGWLEGVAAAQRADVPLAYRVIDRCRALKLSGSMAAAVAFDTSRYPREAVTSARDAVMTKYGPPTLTAVSDAQGWEFA